MTPNSGDRKADDQPIEGGDSLTRAAFEYFTAELTTSLTAARALVGHHLMRGEMLEGTFRQALRNFLPERFRFLSGQVVNGRAASCQQDLVIVDADSGTSLWRMGDVGVIPIESVVGTVEIKTSLDATEVRQAVANVESVKRMVAGRHGVVPRAPVVPFGGIVGFDARVHFETLADTFGEACAAIAEPTHRCDALLLVGKGAVMPGVADERPELRYWHDKDVEDGRQLVFDDKEDGALLFLHRLSEHIKRYQPPPADLVAYAKIGRTKPWRFSEFTPKSLTSHEGAGS